jgi:pimeloyl-ACP methyl ester carboxylesterase
MGSVGSREEIRTVRSIDGTPIAFERLGDGPPVILVGGALGSGVRSFPPFVKLAELLSPTFTVYLYDRRGRGDSGDSKTYAVEREVEDLKAVIAEAGGSAHVYGLSSGAVLAVEAAARGASITKLGLFEPPLPSGEEGAGSETELRELIAAGRRGDAVEGFLAGIGLPTEAIAGMRQTPEWPQLEAMAHTLMYDGALTEDRTLWTERAPSVTAPAIVLFSEGTSAYLGESARAASNALPNARREVLSGQFHEVTPETLAIALAEFFAA